MAARPPVTGGGAQSEFRNPRLAPLALQVPGAGAVPPPGAPIEIAQPLQANAGAVLLTDADGHQQLFTPQALAAQHEQQLQPLTATGGGPSDRGPVIAAGERPVVQAAGAAGPAAPLAPIATPIDPIASATAEGGQPPPPVVLQRAPRRFGAATAGIRDANRAAAEAKDRQRAANALAASKVVAAPEVAVPPTVADATTTHISQAPKPVVAAGGAGAAVMQAIRERGPQASRSRPASSNTDSPSRGIPRAIDDPNKVITGGFGEGMDAQYFPLDGAELLDVVWLLMDQLAQRLQNDLRFRMSTVYPRVAAKIMVQVDGYAADQTFTIAQMSAPHHRTPEEIALVHGDRVVFIVLEERKEFHADGTIASPPNAMRMEIGAAIPRKQAVGQGMTRQIVDVAPEELG